MMIRKEYLAFDAQRIDVASRPYRAPQFGCEFADYAILLYSWTEIGTPDSSDTFVLTPLFIDDDGNEYIDKDTTFGTITVDGDDADTTRSVRIPYLGKMIGLKATAGSTLSSSEGFILTAKIVLVGDPTLSDEEKELLRRFGI